MVSQFYLSFLDPLPKISFFSPCFTHFINKLKKHKPFSTPFLFPVKKKEAPGYYDIIKNPIDLSTIQKNTENNLYKNKVELMEDIKLMRDNCQLYNISGTIVEYGNEMLKYAEEIISKEEENMEQDISSKNEPVKSTNTTEHALLSESLSSFETEDVIEKIISPQDHINQDKPTNSELSIPLFTNLNVQDNYSPVLAKILLQKWICEYLRHHKFKGVKKEALLILEQCIVWYIKRKVEKQ